MESTHEIGMRVCEALGIDPNVVSGISFYWHPRMEPVIKFTQTLKPGEADELVEIFKHYRLELIEADAKG